MKKMLILMAIAFMVYSSIEAQNFSTEISEAESFYKSGDLHGTRFSLQQALNEIDKAIGEEILKALPVKMGNMVFVESEDNVTAISMGFAGLFVNRNYKENDEVYVNLQLISDSPYLAGINAIMALPSFASDPNQKKIRIGGNRALMQKNQDEKGIQTWDVQIPFGTTLLTFHCVGVNDENEVIEMVNTIPVETIARFAQ